MEGQRGLFVGGLLYSKIGSPETQSARRAGRKSGIIEMYTSLLFQRCSDEPSTQRSWRSGKTDASDDCQCSIADDLIQRLRDYGVHDRFGIPGNYVLSFSSELENSPINVIGCTREDCAGVIGDAKVTELTIHAVLEENDASDTLKKLAERMKEKV